MNKPRTPRKAKQVPTVEIVDEPAPVETPLPWRAPARPPDVPSVWRDLGYALLVVAYLEEEDTSTRLRPRKHNHRNHEPRPGEVAFISSEDGGKYHSLPLALFWRRVQPYAVPISPYRCILSFLARKDSGLSNMRAQDIRRLVAMLTKEELQKLSERDLAQHYRDLVDPKGPARVRASSREEFVNAILAKAQEAAAVKSADAEPSSTTQDAPAESGKEKDVATKKSAAKKPAAKTPAKTAAKASAKPAPKTAAKASAKPDAPKAPKTPKPARELKLTATNPFRPGSMKQKAYELFLKVKGDRAKTVEGTVAIGASDATARGWYTTFCKV